MIRLPPDIDALPPFALKPLTLGLLEENARLQSENTALREEIARLMGQKGRPVIKQSVPVKPLKPSGMDKATEPMKNKERSKAKKRPRVKNPLVHHEDRVIKVTEIPAGSRFKGYEEFSVQDLKIEIRMVRYRRERWLTPDGRTVVAILPAGVRGHFGPELKRFIIAQYHQGQTTVPRLVVTLRALGLIISKRQVLRILEEDKDSFLDEARNILRAGLSNGGFISTDDTGARHKGKNGVCTQIGNDRFTFFATTGSKSRANFLSLLRAGHTDYVHSDEAFAYMRGRNLSGIVITKLAGDPQRKFADEAAWKAHLDQLGITGMRVTPNPVTVASEGALWGSITAHGFLDGMVVLSDDAGQFNIGVHALCWVHAERLIHKLDTFTDAARAAKETVRTLLWWLYADLKAYRLSPDSWRKAELSTQFDHVFKRTTGFVSLDRLLARISANKAELLRVLDRPDIPLHTNGSENDIRCHVTRRKISGTTRSDLGRDVRDAFLSLMKTCSKLGVSFWNYLGSRLGTGDAHVPSLAELVAAR